MAGLFITGTDTEIGKTLIVALLTYGLKREGMEVCPIKSIGAGGINYEGHFVSEDVKVYRDLGESDMPVDVMNPLCFEKRASPHYAAECEKTGIDSFHILEPIKSAVRQYEAVLVEGIGGWMVPLSPNYYVADLAHDLDWPVLVVSPNCLGTINHTLLTIASIRQYGLKPAGVIFNSLDNKTPSDIQRNNIDTVRECARVDILGEIPYLQPKLLRKNSAKQRWDTISEVISWDKIKALLHTEPRR